MENELPHSIDTEKAILGSILKDPKVLDMVIEILPNPRAFYSPKHRRIYETILHLYGLLEPADITNVNRLAKDVTLVYLVDLVENNASVFIENHAKTIQQYFRLRLLIEISRDNIRSACERPEEAIDVIDEAEQRIYALSNSGGGLDEPRPISDFTADSFELINCCQAGEAQKVHIQTGFPSVDRIIHGLRPGNSYILAGHTSHGKSQMALQIANNVALKGKPVYFVSLEMPEEELNMRLLCTLARVDSGLAEKPGALTSFHWDKLTRAQTKIYTLPFHIKSRPRITIPELRASARRSKSKYNIKLLIVDYLQLIDPGKHANREREVAFISSNMKSIAMELGISTLTLSQLSRRKDSKDRAPLLQDLRDSGMIENDADGVIFVYHDEKGNSEIIVKKYRGGKPGKTSMAFIEGRWEELSYRKEEDLP